MVKNLYKKTYFSKETINFIFTENLPRIFSIYLKHLNMPMILKKIAKLLFNLLILQKANETNREN